MLKLRVGMSHLKIPHVARKSLSATTKTNAMQSKKKKRKEKKRKKNSTIKKKKDAQEQPHLASHTLVSVWTAFTFQESLA